MNIVTFGHFCVQLLQVCFPKSFPVAADVAVCSLRHIKRLAMLLFSPAQKAPVPLAALFLAHLMHASQTLFLLLLNLCIMNQLLHVFFSQPGGQAAWQGSTAKTQTAQVRKALLCKSSHQECLNPKAGMCLNGGALP